MIASDDNQTSCGGPARVKDRPTVELVDLPCFGRAAWLVWRKHRWSCPRPECPTGSWAHAEPPHRRTTGRDDRPGGPVGHDPGRPRGSLGQRGRRALGCDWHTISDTVVRYGSALLEADVDRIGEVNALGLDETLFCRAGRWRTQQWCTSIVDVGPGARLLDVVLDRNATAPTRWIATQLEAWRAGIRYGVLNLSGPYRKVLSDTLGHATQVADPFHVVKLANSKLDECRRRVQNETLGHRGHKHDPLYRSRRLLTKADERLDGRGRTRLLGLLDAGDPRGDVRTAWHAN